MSKALKILLLEDEPSDAELIQNELLSALEIPLEFKQVDDKTNFIKALSTFKPDIVLSDYRLPRYDGLSALQDMRKISSETPFIIVTGSLSEEAAADAIKSGAWDYVVKERLFRLKSAVGNALELKSERQQIQKAQENLKKSEERFRLISTSAKDAIIMMDERGLVNFWNPASEKIFGYSEQEMLGKPLHDIIAPEPYLSQYKSAADDFRKHGIGNAVGNTMEVEARHKDGTPVPVELSLARMNLEGKWGAVGVIRDISERKKAETALRESETRYRTLFEQSQDAIYILYNERFMRINQRFSDLFGYQPEEVYNPEFNFMQLVADESRGLIEERLRRLQNGENLEPVYEFIAKNKNGQRVFCEVSASYVNYENGVATQGIIRDISARKAAEEEILKLSQAVEQSPVSVMLTDLDGNIEYVNQQFVKNSGYQREEAIGQNPRFLKSGETTQEEYKVLWDTIKSGKTWTGEFHNIKKNGELFWEETIIAPIFNSEGQATHFLALRQDVTQQKVLEEQFRQAQKMEAVGHLAGGIAHDFNNLLTVINGFSELLISRIDETSPMREDLLQIKQAGHRAGALTRQLLAFSRKQILRPEILDANALISNMEKMLGRLITESIKMNTSYAPNLKRIKMDPGQLEQVVMNLVVNARDAMPEGGTLTIETENIYLDEKYSLHHKDTPSGWYIIINISDTGVGMDADIKKHIFEPFFTTKEKGRGTGLGLSTVYGIIKQSGGNIIVDSEPGNGTTFKIYLPALDQTQPQLTEPTDTQLNLKGDETIFVVEDEDAVRALVCRTLSSYGYNIKESANPAEALERLKSSDLKIDLLLTDMIMPNLSGKQLAEKALKQRPKLKILYMSGYTDEVIIHQGIQGKRTSFIHKPFTNNELLRQIRQILDENSA